MSARRGFLKGLAVGCAAAFGWRVWPRTPEPALQLARRVVQALGTVAPPLRVSTERSIPQLLVTVFGPTTTLGDLAQLTTAQLQQLLTQRIQQDYQNGALVQHQGWWLADSEAAILELNCRLVQSTSQRASTHAGGTASTYSRRA
jgi:hypothetical protein